MIRLNYLDGDYQTFSSYRSMIENLADDGTFDDHEIDPNCRRFQASMDRYDSCELFHPETEDSIEALYRDGEIIGVLDERVPDNLSEFVKFEELKRLEGERDAHRELMTDVAAEMRRAS